MKKQYPASQAAGAFAPVYLTESQLAIRWGVSPKKLQSDRYYGRGVRYIKLRRAVRYALAHIEEYELLNTVEVKGGPSNA